MKKQEEFISLNESFNSEFEIQELEQRLETDPLLFVDFFQQSTMAAGGGDVIITCSDSSKLKTTIIFV